MPISVVEIAKGERLVSANTIAQIGNASHPVMLAVSPTQTSATTGNLSGLGGTTTAHRLSPNGQYIVGTSHYADGTSEGVVWSTSSLQQAIGIGPPAGVLSTAGHDIANLAIAVGQAGNGAQAVQWTATDGLLTLPVPVGAAATANAISADGKLKVGAIGSAQSMAKAALWSDAGYKALPDGGALASVAIDISPNGWFVVGSATIGTTEVAAFWDAGRQFHVILDAGGQPLEGRALGVSDNGYVVGASATGGWVYRLGWTSARSFNAWLNSSYGLNLPKASNAVNDVYFDGIDLNFAVTANGTGYFVTVNAPVIAGGSNGTPTHVGSEGNDTIVIDLADPYPEGDINVLTGGGDDVVVIVGAANEPVDVHVDAGTGDDTVIVDASGDVDISIDFGSGDDTLIDHSQGDDVDIEVVDGDAVQPINGGITLVGFDQLAWEVEADVGGESETTDLFDGGDEMFGGLDGEMDDGNAIIPEGLTAGDLLGTHVPLHGNPWLVSLDAFFVTE